MASKFEWCKILKAGTSEMVIVTVLKLKNSHSSMQYCNQKMLQKVQFSFNPLYTGGLLDFYMLESICHFRTVRSILPLLFYF